jgi:hypothetical protein
MNLQEYRVVNTTFSIKHSDSGHLIEADSGIKQEGVHLFTNLFAPRHLATIDNNLTNDFISCIPPLITEAHNTMLLAPFSLEDIKNVISSLVLDEDPGPNGFTTLFNKKC